MIPEVEEEVEMTATKLSTHEKFSAVSKFLSNN